MNFSSNKIFLSSVVLLLLGFLIGPTIGYLLFAIIILMGLIKTEFLLVALLLVGMFKNLDIFKSFPIDLTILVVAITIYIAFLITFLRSKIKKIGPIEILILLQGLLVLSSAYFVSKAGDLKWWNAGRFLAFNLPLFYLPLLIIHHKKQKLQIKNIILGIYFISISFLGIAFHNLYFGKLTSWHLTAFGESYIGLSIYMSFGIIFLLHHLICKKSKILTKIGYFILLMFFSIGLTLSPSRGILVSFILVIFIIFLKIITNKNTNLKRILVLCCLMLSITAIGFLTFQRAKIAGFNIRRLIPNMDSMQSLIGVRTRYYHDAIKNFTQKPLIGAGVGMFSYEHGGRGKYPHNIFLEVATEYGLIGIIIFWPFFIYLFYLALKLIKNIPKNNSFVIIPLWFLIIFLDAMVSGSIANNRNIWLFGAIILIITKNIQNQKTYHQITNQKTNMKKYQICTKCIMDTTDPDITFDQNGVCNHCKNYEKRIKTELHIDERGQKKLKQLIDKIRKDGEDKKYNCIIGISGGIDSTMVAYLVIKKFNLKPLAINLDNGWDANSAKQNIENISKNLDLEIHKKKVHWEEFKVLQLSFLKSSTSNIEIPTDHAITALLYKIAAKHNIPYIITGSNLVTEAIMPRSWGYSYQDWKFIKNIHKKFGNTKLKNYPHLTLSDWIYCTFVKKIKFIPILNYIQYIKKDTKKFLKNNFNWQDYGGNHYESIYTRFFQGYILPTKFGFDKRRAHLSTLICSKQIRRDEALKIIEQNPYPNEKMLKKDKKYFMEKIGITEEKFQKLISQPIKTFKDYPNNNFFFNKLKFLVKIAKKIATNN